jgi:hypothetical protein
VIRYDDDVAMFEDTIGADEAEPLLEWLQRRPAPRIDFAGCVHVHPANLQVLMAADVAVIEWPADPQLAMWLRSALVTKELS